MIHKIIAFLLILCAAVQYNDPDFYIWMPVYLVAAIFIIGYVRGWNNTMLGLSLCAIYALGMLTYSPDVLSWIENGSPTIAGTMQAESPFIEFIREFFGLGICLIVLLIYTYLMRNRSASQELKSHT